MIKKITLSTLIIATSLFASSNEQELIKKVKEIGIFKAPSLEVNRVIDKGSLLHVGATNTLQNGQKQPVEAFITSDLEYVILGKAFTAKKGEELFIPVEMKDFAKDAAFTIGAGKKEFFLFTDPECPYCVNLEKEVISKLSKETLKDIKINVVLFPLPFHKNAKNMSYYIMSQKDNAAKYKAIKNIMLDNDTTYASAKYSTSELEKLNASLDKQMEIIQKLGINGTPTILNIEGKKINPSELLK